MSNTAPKSLHGQVINYKDLNRILPKRDDFLDKAIYKKVNKILKKERNLLFFPTGLWDDKPMQAHKYDKSKYKIVLFGILEDGRRVSVVINDILPYFEIKVPDKRINDKEAFAEDIIQEISMSADDYNKFAQVIGREVKQTNQYWKIEPVNHEIVEGKPLKYYQEHNSYYIRIYFNKLMHRKDAIDFIRAKGYETTHDDKSCYYRVVCRDTLLSFSSWMVLKEFTTQSDEENNYLRGDVIQVSINNIECADMSNTDAAIDLLGLRKDKTMTMCWDIETYNSTEDGEIPEPVIKRENKEVPNWNHVIFMIGITFQWFNAGDQLLRVCLVDVPSAPHPEFLTVVCESEQNLIKAFAKCYDNMRPEIVMGFNDASYDWPWIIRRAEAYTGLLKYIGDKFDITKPVHDEKRTDATFKYNFKKIQVKIEADVNAVGQNFQVPGFIPVDVMIVFRQLYPTSEKWSLNFFLSKNKLGGKEDMPYYEMFQIYKDSLNNSKLKEPLLNTELLEKMALVGKYCVIDAQRCHELMKIRSVIQDKREVANISYTSMFDAFYRANGMKVRNLVIARGQLRGLKMTNIPNDQVEIGKYPGAWVFPPIKGLVTSKLSLSERIKKANMGYEEYAAWSEKSEEEIKKELDFIKENGAFLNPDETREISPSLHQILQEQTGRPITGLDFSSLYPSLIMTYNLSPEYIIVDKKYAREVNGIKNPDGTKKHTLYRIEFPFNSRMIKGWSVRHDNKLDPALSDYKFGIFPAILKELFDTRAKLKKGEKGLNYWEHKKEELQLIAKEDPERWNSKEVQDEYEDICFNYNALDSKQKALKVFMNTFYGECGNKRSPVFLLQVAGGITSSGQKNIKRAYDFVQERGCKVYYGDSVAAYTPVIIRYTKGLKKGNIDIRTIDDIPSHTGWFDYPQFKPSETEPIRINKQQHIPEEGLETWTSLGWSPIRRVIRHKTNKRMFRVNTHLGCVDVTEDHSLINCNKESLKTSDAKIGDKLFHSFPEEFYNKLPYKTIPNRPLNLYMTNRHDFLNAHINDQAYYLRRRFEKNHESKRLIIYEFDQLVAQIICYLMYAIGCKNVYVNVLDNGRIYELSSYYNEEREIDEYKLQSKNQIKKIIELPEVTTDEFVYDLETEDGTFQAGVGSLIISNTDSLYISVPEAEFKFLDNEYYAEQITKLQYWEGMVETTFNVIQRLNKEVNLMFRADNGTEFLKMAYEEVLYPVLFTAKKKYVGIPHISKPNFDISVPLFIRGLELKKRGVSEILKNVCNDILRKCTSWENVLTVIEIVQSKIREIYSADWSDHFNDFIMTAVYKPHKKNVRVHTFRDRMIIERNLILKPGERFNYVITQKYPYRYDMRGRKIPLKIGDKMESADIAQEEKMLIDLDYYMDKSINGQLARFITYHPDFHVETKNYTDKDEVKKAEDKILKNARKFIDNICKEYYKKYEDNGKAHKENFRKSAKIVFNKMISKYGEKDIIKLLGFSVEVDDDIGTWLVQKIFSVVEKKAVNKTYGRDYVEDRLGGLGKIERNRRLVELQNLYYAHKKHNLLKYCENQYLERHEILEIRLRKSIINIKSLFHTNNKIVEKLIQHLSTSATTDSSAPNLNTPNIEQELEDLADKSIQEKYEDIKKNILEVKFLYMNMIGNYEYIYRIRKIVEYLKEIRDEKAHVVKAPQDIKKTIEQLVQEASAEFIKEQKHK